MCPSMPLKLMHQAPACAFSVSSGQSSRDCTESWSCPLNPTCPVGFRTEGPGLRLSEALFEVGKPCRLCCLSGLPKKVHCWLQTPQRWEEPGGLPLRSCCAQHSLGPALARLRPPVGVRENPKGRCTEKAATELCQTLPAASRSVQSSGRQVFSKTDSKDSWNLVLFSSGFQPILLRQAVQSIS